MLALSFSSMLVFFLFFYNVIGKHLSWGMAGISFLTAQWHTVCFLLGTSDEQKQNPAKVLSLSTPACVIQMYASLLWLFVKELILNQPPPLFSGIQSSIFFIVTYRIIVEETNVLFTQSQHYFQELISI